MIAGPLYIVALLLATAGVAKLAAPHSTRAALYAVGLPSSTVVVWAMAVVELAAAASLVVVGGRGPAVALAVIHLGFTVFLVVGLRSGRLTSCGCFGDGSVAPGPLHVGYDLAATAVAVVAVVRPVPAADVLLADQPWAAIPYLGLVALGTVLAWAMLSVLPLALAPPARSTDFAMVSTPSPTLGADR